MIFNWCLLGIQQVFTEGEVNIGENTPRQSQGKYSLIN